MKKQIKISLFLIILILSINLSGCVNTSTNNEIDTGEEFQFTSLEGERKNLSEYRGKIIILDMWATWCGPCILQMDELKKTYDNYTRDQLEILSINIDPREPITMIKGFIIEYAEYFGYELDWIFGNEYDDLSNYMPSGSIPTTVIFDQKGNVHNTHSGVIYYNELKEKIDELI